MDVQLHTHRHRIPLDRAEFFREIEENRRGISKVSGERPVHFCCPNGVYQSHISDWLDELEIRSAVTCELGLGHRPGKQNAFATVVGFGKSNHEGVQELDQRRGVMVIAPETCNTTHLPPPRSTSVHSAPAVRNSPDTGIGNTVRPVPW